MSAPTASRYGALLDQHGVRFHIWTQTPDVQLVVEGHPLSPFTEFTLRPDGLSEIHVPGLTAGARYGYLLNGQGPFPDPASRFQPDGVHALSEVIDPSFEWTARFQPPPLAETVLYELHLGTFTPEGTYAAAAEKLPLLRDLGITAVELMPLADCPGRRNWGYDGVCLFAPNRNYGRPDDLRRFIDRAHSLGLAVYLDAVYNHLGPDGAYHRLFHPAFYDHAVQTPWGDGLNFHGPESDASRAFFLDNGLHWFREYHIDGFRLDATHAIVDHGEPHFLQTFAATIHAAAETEGRPCRVIAEDERNLIQLLDPPARNGYDLDAVWADDFHHQLRRATAGDLHGYYADYTGSPADIAATIRQGWFYTGQHSEHHRRPRGTPTNQTALERFVVCIQNHDQIGNRARGERLNHQISLESYRAASALLLLVPETPLLFMGQEWAATSPFQFFTDHNAELGRLVTEGRRREFSHFPEFSEPATRETIPDPQAESTFLRSKLNWEERNHEPHAATWRWYQRLLALRKHIRRQYTQFEIQPKENLLILNWHGPKDTLLALVALTGAAGCSALPTHAQTLLTSEDSDFTTQPLPPLHHPSAGTLRLQRAGCVVLRVEGGASHD